MLLLSLLACSDGVLHLSDANNHQVTLTYDVPILSADTDSLQILWESVASDLRCEAIFMAEPKLDLVTSPLSPEEFLTAIATDDLRGQDLVGLVSLDLEPGEPAYLSEMSFFDTPVETGLNEDHSHIFVLSDGGTGVGRIASLAFLEPGGTDTTITLPDGCGQAEVAVTLGEPISLRRVERIDWSGLTTNAIGSPLSTDSIDGFQLAEGAAASVESDYFALESAAEVVWSAEIDDVTSIAIDDLDTDADTLALTCSTCVLPVPLFLATIED
ncbi:MAG: hypothetical protein ACI8RZ_006486 [Myxococcota bacterium]|jgi:hypothetical protein